MNNLLTHTKMNKTLSNSEFCQLLVSRFPLDKNDHYLLVCDGQGMAAIFAKETAKGYSTATINGKTYTKMTADEKRAAVEYIANVPVDIIATKFDWGNGVYESYFLAGAWNEYCEKDKGQFWYEKMKASFISATPVPPVEI